MFNALTHHQSANFDEQINQLAQLISNSHHTIALTGAGISVASDIPDLEQLSGGTTGSLSSESYLEAHPDDFYRQFHQLFIDPIFNVGPTAAHKVLAQLEHHQLLDGVITTNVDYLHERAGSHNTANIWSSLNINHCVQCGRIYPLEILREPVPHCPNCGGLISPDPIFRNIATVPAERERADLWTNTADLVLVTGANGYYDHVESRSTLVDINPAQTEFDDRATLVIRATADKTFAALAGKLNLPITTVTK
ncbi:NAD-dependent protein deacetylase of SIR2 [Furfurilactobacillus rossiae]|uniref:SIR2 family NAD-dependent protein deacylase n=1 Tax=Furfurilactobacillus rossiae TaxID=231049 RepID=UPI0015BDC0EF|nr:Sir2 family NAD-dependent protein deacetylase [Furfurilactobacillus rossiae]MCF6165750.1 hypothetical protein [Furfurilactobacillus rossiae]QLE63126.1 NAD-dependent protein deacetylase of SIR2 [Furfurilactobacillus rossiae]